MNKTIVPYLSCLLSEEEYLKLSPSDVTLPVTYVLSDDLNLYKRTRTAGGYALTLQKEVPKDLRTLTSKIAPSFSHLPGGKMSIGLISQIGSWFKDIAKESSDEAMAHILWNKTRKQYEIGIPTQSVSGASVDYKFDDVTTDHVIILDIHSHNNMGSFWSGTDDKDDCKGVWISGVLGNFGTRPTINLRFSDRGSFIKTSFEEIFDGSFDQVDFSSTYPKEEWNAKVSFRKYSTGWTSKYPTFYSGNWPQSQENWGYTLEEEYEDNEIWERYPHLSPPDATKVPSRFRRSSKVVGITPRDLSITSYNLSSALRTLQGFVSLDEESIAKIKTQTLYSGYFEPLLGLVRLLPDHILPLLLTLLTEEVLSDARAADIREDFDNSREPVLNRLQEKLLELEEALSILRYPT